VTFSEVNKAVGDKKKVALAQWNERKLVIEEIGSGDFAAVEECIKKKKKGKIDSLKECLQELVKLTTISGYMLGGQGTSIRA
jgi:hypothetical protein